MPEKISICLNRGSTTFLEPTFFYVLVELAEAQERPGAHNLEKHNNRSFTNLMI